MQAREEPDGSLLLTYDSIRLSRFFFILAALPLGTAAYDYLLGARGSDRMAALLAAAATLMLAGLFFLEQARAVVNPLERTIVWSRRWLFRRRSGTLSFDDIAVVFPERPIGDEGTPSRRIVLRTKDGRMIPLTQGYAPDMDDGILRSSERIASMLGPRVAAVDTVDALVIAGRPIDAIKHLRETRGLPLEEAKRQVDAIRQRNST